MAWYQLIAFLLNELIRWFGLGKEILKARLYFMNVNLYVILQSIVKVWCVFQHVSV